MKTAHNPIGLILASTFAALLGSPSLQAECRAGAYTIISGDTMEYQGERIHLKGVKAPTAEDPYALASERALQMLVALNCPVRCFVSDRTGDGETVAVCYGGDESDINAAMIRKGHARIDPDYPDYLDLEKQAKKEKLGLWSGKPPEVIWSWPTRDGKAPEDDPTGQGEERPDAEETQAK